MVWNSGAPSEVSLEFSWGIWSYSCHLVTSRSPPGTLKGTRAGENSLITVRLPFLTYTAMALTLESTFLVVCFNRRPILLLAVVDF